jgi:large subunit ribosomal protein L17
MRHGKTLNHLGRKAEHREALMMNMANALIEHKRINTTLAKAKALRKYIEPLITKSKTDSTHSRRVVFSYLKNKYAVTELFREVAPKVATRNGGYSRIIKLGWRPGDNADMCMIELVDFNTMYGNDSAAATTKKRTRRGGAAKKETTGATDTATDTATDAAAPAPKAKKAKKSDEGAADAAPEA